VVTARGTTGLSVSSRLAALMLVAASIAASVAASKMESFFIGLVEVIAMDL
jgi:general stress protein CsbA